MDPIQKIIIASLFLILLGSAGYAMRIPQTLPDNALPGGENLAAGEPAANNILVEDQAPGSTVKIFSVSVDRPAWAVIRENKNGIPGNILGAARFDSGQRQTGTVELLRDTGGGNVYYAQLYQDDGDRLFDHKKDAPITDASGNPIFVRFVASVSLEE